MKQASLTSTKKSFALCSKMSLVYLGFQTKSGTWDASKWFCPVCLAHFHCEKPNIHGIVLKQTEFFIGGINFLFIAALGISSLETVTWWFMVYVINRCLNGFFLVTLNIRLKSPKTLPVTTWFLKLKFSQYYKRLKEFH